MLFHKRTRKIIKYVWAVFAVMIALTMVVAYSGFASLARIPEDQEPIEIPAEVREQLRAQQMGENINFGNTPEEIEIMRAIEEGRIDLGGTTSTSAPVFAEEEATTSEPEYSEPQKDDLKLEI